MKPLGGRSKTSRDVIEFFSMNRTLIALLIMMTSATLVGCGTVATDPGKDSVADTTGSTSGKSACELLTKEIAEQVLEAKVNDATAHDTDSTYATVSTCNYLAEDSFMHAVGLLIRHSKEKGEALTSFDGAIEQSQSLSGVAPQMVDGLGDKAYWAGGTLKQLNIIIGNDLLIFSSLDKDEEKAKDITRKTADLVMPKL